MQFEELRELFIRVSINLNQKHALKTVSWTHTPKHEWGIK